MQLPIRTTRLAVVMLVPLLTGCAGGSDDRSEQELAQDISIELQSAPHDLDEETADCYADTLVEEVGADRLEEVEFAAADPEELGEAIAAAMITAAEECGATSTTDEEADQ
ncbi:MAG: hypothetical protein ABWZ76_10445 [Acidimicrobiales bacterium]